ncbi:MAG: hypothetical protein CM15mP78_04930 [Candidatus Poseidoniales archaeon]|nr:MAG: hypothetical protein CM15mP78_04930 [Candidatus Poseidoniales archaeon]
MRASRRPCSTVCSPQVFRLTPPDQRYPPHHSSSRFLTRHHRLVLFPPYAPTTRPATEALEASTSAPPSSDGDAPLAVRSTHLPLNVHQSRSAPCSTSKEEDEGEGARESRANDDHVPNQHPGGRHEGPKRLPCVGASSMERRSIGRPEPTTEHAGVGPCARFSSSGKTLLVAPRALPTDQLRKALQGMGWPSLSSEMKRLGHAWVDASPAKVEGEIIEEEFHYEGVWQAAGDGNQNIPWSATHLELLKRWGVQTAQVDGEVAGRAEPALRMVSKV